MSAWYTGKHTDATAYHTQSSPAASDAATAFAAVLVNRLCIVDGGVDATGVSAGAGALAGVASGVASGALGATFVLLLRSMFIKKLAASVIASARCGLL